MTIIRICMMRTCVDFKHDFYVIISYQVHLLPSDKIYLNRKTDTSIENMCTSITLFSIYFVRWFFFYRNRTTVLSWKSRSIPIALILFTRHFNLLHIMQSNHECLCIIYSIARGILESCKCVMTVTLSNRYRT